MNYSTTTLITGASTAVASTISCRTEDEEKNKRRRNMYAGTTVATTATAAVGASLNAKSYHDYFERKQLEAEQSRQSYVDSLSDEELENALRQMQENEVYDYSRDNESSQTVRK